MASIASPSPAAAPVFTHWSKGFDPASLNHIPGDDGIPILGTTLKLLADPVAYGNHLRERYGTVARTRSFGRRQIVLTGADANELVLFDRNKVFSSEQGWGPVLDQLFPRGLMLMDFEKHRVDRRALSIAFKPEPMRHYADKLNEGIARRTDEWGAGDLTFYPAIKALTLDLAATSFLGLPLGPEADALNKAFVDMVQASIGIVRKPLPFTAMGRGVAGRKLMVDWFTPQVLSRRAGGGQDMFSQFARATDEAGAYLPVDAVVDHMIFLMMAAHDTITSSATSLVWLLAKSPEWQDKLRREALAVTGGPDAGGKPRPLAYDDLGRMELTEMAFKEALRLIPPVPSTPRRALRDFEFGGYRIPAGTPVSISAQAVHKMPEYWPDPDRFDPTRFTPENSAGRHKYAWVPFGGGAHMCIGLHFAYMQIKILMAQMLMRYEISVAPGYEPDWAPWPIPKPKDGLKIKLTAV